MATDNHAHFTRIGFTVIIGVAAIVATLIYLGGFRDRKNEFIVETYYDSSVNGLTVGSPVNLFGVKIGEVREIVFTDNVYGDRGAGPEDLRRVSILMAINRQTFGFDANETAATRACLEEHIARGLRATIAINAVTGLGRIDLNIVDHAPPAAPLGWTPRYVLIPPSPSLLESFSVAATKLANKLKTMDFGAVWSNINRTANAAARTAENADAMLEGSRAGVRQIVNDVSEASAAFKEMTQMLKDNPSRLLRASDPTPLPETAR